MKKKSYTNSAGGTLTDAHKISIFELTDTILPFLAN